MKNAYLLILLLLICNISLAQEEVPDLPTFPSPCDNNNIFPAFRNASFEGLGICVGPPIPWNNCGASDNGNDPFPITSRGACLNINETASDGNSFLIFISDQDNNQQSGTGIVINPALQANQEYAFLIDLMKVENNDCMTFEVYGSERCGDEEELLWQSTEIQNTDNWQPYLVAFTPQNNHRYITLRATSICGEGRLLADNIRAYSEAAEIKPAIQTTSTQLCGADTYIYTNPVENATFRWLKDGNELIETTDNFLLIDEAGSYSVNLLTDCREYESEDLVIEAGNPPNAPTIIGDAVLCGDGETISLFVQNPLPNTDYEWYLEGNPDRQAVGVEYNPDLPGLYTVRAINGCGNSTSEPFEVIEGPTPRFPIISGGAELCLNETATLAVENPENGVTYFWFAIGSANAIAEGPVLTTQDAGAYFVVADNACKTARSNAEFIVNIPDAVCNGTGDDCSDVAITEMPFYDQPARGFFETARAGSDFTGEDSCEPDFFEGKEFVFRYVPEADQCINVQIGNPEKQPLGLLVTQQCEPFRECIATSISEDGSNPEINGLSLNAGEIYYFVIGTSLAGQNVPFLFIMDECVSDEECPEGVVSVPAWENPGLEDTPGEDKAPVGWEKTGIQSIFAPFSPDIEPLLTTQVATEGNSFVMITAFPGGTNDNYQEGIAQALDEPLLVGTEYAFSVDLANPASQPGEFRGCGGIEIWGGNGVEDFVELLWTSPAIADNSDWQSFTVNFEPAANYTHIQILSALYPGCNRDYILIDNLKEITTDIETPEIQTTTDILCPGEIPILSTEEVEGVIYQWFLDDNPIGTNTSSIEAQEAGEYKVSITIQCNTVESDPITINDVEVPEMPTIVGDDFLCIGAATRLSVENGDASQTYAWYLNGLALDITTPELDATEVGTYTVGIQYECGEILSEAFELGFEPQIQEPEITGQTVFCAENTGEVRLLNPQADVNYQWFFEGEPVIGAEGTRIELIGEGTYYLEAYGICNTTRSLPFEVTLADAPLQPIIEMELAVCGVDFMRISVSNVEDGIDYIWVLNGLDTLQDSNVPFIETNLLGEYKVFASNGCVSTASDALELENNAIETQDPAISGETAICEGTITTLTVDNFDPTFEYQWFKDGERIQGATLNELVVSEEGVYSVQQFDGCDEKFSNDIEISLSNEILTLGITGPNSVCEDGTIQLIATGVPLGADVLWFKNDKETPISQEIELEVTEAGSYYFTVNTNCDTQSSNRTEISIRPKLEIPPIFGENTICEGASTILNIDDSEITDVVTINWFLEGETTPLGTGNSLEVSLEGNYYVEITYDCGTERGEVFPIEFTDLSEAPEILGDNQICEGGSVTLSLDESQTSNVVEINWFLEGRATPLGTGNTLEVLQVGTYYAEVIYDCGTARSELFNVLLSPLPEKPEIIGENLICEGTNTLLSVEPQENVTYTWVQDGQYLGKNTPEISANVFGNYEVVVTNTCGSVTSEAFLLEAITSDISTSNDTSIELGETVQMFVNGGTQYIWSPEQSLDNPSINNPIASPEETTTYTVLATTEEGCEVERSITITVLPPSTVDALNIPNVFSPNNDGFNDFWEIAGASFFNNLEVTVFDRWGTQVFYTANYREPWDGILNGRILPVGTYFYVIQLEVEGEKKRVTGHVSILK